MFNNNNNSKSESKHPFSQTSCSGGKEEVFESGLCPLSFENPESWKFQVEKRSLQSLGQCFQTVGFHRPLTFQKTLVIELPTYFAEDTKTVNCQPFTPISFKKGFSQQQPAITIPIVNLKLKH